MDTAEGCQEAEFPRSEFHCDLLSVETGFGGSKGTVYFMGKGCGDGRADSGSAGSQSAGRSGAQQERCVNLDEPSERAFSQARIPAP